MATPDRTCVLVVEDDGDVRAALSDLLCDEGFEVICAENGLDALEKLQQMDPPDLILLDLLMPVMNGWQFIKAQKRDPRLLYIPVVVISAEDSGKRKAAALGADGYLPKPIRPGQLWSTVELYCRYPAPRIPKA